MAAHRENAWLHTIRRLVVTARYDVLLHDDVTELVATVARLDAWLSAGKTLPAAWARATRRGE